MELQIQNLISSIQQDGIDRANKESAAIVADAKEQAASILAQAKEEAEKVREDAKKEVAVFQSNAQLSAEQAKRDAVLAFKQEIQVQFEKILAADVSKALSEKTMATLITAALNGEDASSYSVEVNEVTDALKQELAQLVKAGLEIRPSKKVRSGFRLAAKDGSGYFDCSDEEISKMLMPFFRDIHL
jgi:V/A-type H+-transporting ATPase subunit E